MVGGIHEQLIKIQNSKMNRKTVAALLIVKNEEALLARCLDSLKGCSSIWILDTGSTDQTVSIARRYTENTFLDYVWVDDFSGAQNFLIEKVRTHSKEKIDFFLSVDADEQLLCPWEEVERAASLAQNVVRVHMIAEGGAKNDFGFGRLFRNTPDIYWCQPIHKHLNVPGEGEPVGNVSIMYGHSPAHELDPNRSLRMLEKAVEDEYTRGEQPVRNLYYLGREYWYKEKYKECTETLGKYVQVAHWIAEKAEAFLIMSQCYSRQGLDEDAKDACLQAIKLNPEFKESIQWMAGIVPKEHAMQWSRMARAANNNDVLWKRTETERSDDIIFLSVHHDDESLFGAITLLRYKPLVVICTSSHIQPERGDLGCTDEIRSKETIEAMKIAGCPVVFLGIKDTELTEEILRERLKWFNPARIYVPAIQGGNLQHDIVGKVGMELFGIRCERYCTYERGHYFSPQGYILKPTEEEFEIKLRMLECYQSQKTLASTRGHFIEVVNQRVEALI